MAYAVYQNGVIVAAFSTKIHADDFVENAIADGTELEIFVKQEPTTAELVAWAGLSFDRGY